MSGDSREALTLTVVAGKTWETRTHAGPGGLAVGDTLSPKQGKLLLLNLLNRCRLLEQNIQRK